MLFLSKGASNDMALAIPNLALGTAYIVAGYQESTSLQGVSRGFSEFVIVSNQNDTHVTIVPSCTSIGGSTAGSVLNIVLDRGQTYQYQCSNKKDVTGTRITSDKAVGVISGNACAEIPVGSPSCSVLSEMLFPVKDGYGTEFFSTSTGYVYATRIAAAYDGTTVTVDQGGLLNNNQAKTNLYQLNAGQILELLGVEPDTHFISTKPVAITEYNQGYNISHQGDPFQVQLIPVGAYKNKFRVYTPFISEQYAMITAPNAAVTSVTLNGQLVTGFMALPGGTHQFGWVELPIGQNIIEAEQPIAVYGIGIGRGMSYGYPAGF